MKSYLSYISAGGKVFYDKAYDYVTYYCGYTRDDLDTSDDLLKDYTDVLEVELYQKEGTSKRIYPANSYYMEYSAFVDNPTHVIDNIYLGSAYNAASYKILKELDIEVIINATTEISNYFPNDFIYSRYKLYDNNKNSIKKYLKKSFNNIIEYQKKVRGNILVHCFMGSSRSASIVIYYLMRTQKNNKNQLLNFDEAVSFLKQKRIIINPTFRLTKDLASSVWKK